MLSGHRRDVMSETEKLVVVVTTDFPVSSTRIEAMSDNFTILTTNQIVSYLTY